MFWEILGILDAGYWMLDKGVEFWNSGILGFGNWVEHVWPLAGGRRPWTVDREPWTVGRGLWAVGFCPWAMERGTLMVNEFDTGCGATHGFHGWLMREASKYV